MDTSVDATPVGRLVDSRYRIDATIARGGMATVYKAFDTRLERSIALKIMHPELAADDDFVSRFIGEARSAARLSDPHVVGVYDQGEDDGAVYLAMEYVEGQTLRQVLRERRRLNADIALEILESVLTALAAAHTAGFVHRDVKPENVLLGDDGRVTVADFGLARAVADSSNATRGLLLGTVSYVSPEQALGEQATTRSDVYSSGILLYELLTGTVPHEGPTDFVVVRKHIDEDVPLVSRTVSVAPEVDELVKVATSRDPAERYADASRFLTAARRAHAAQRQFDPDAAGDHDSTTDDTRESAGVAVHEAFDDSAAAQANPSQAGPDQGAPAGPPPPPPPTPASPSASASEVTDVGEPTQLLDHAELRATLYDEPQRPGLLDEAFADDPADDPAGDDMSHSRPIVDTRSPDTRVADRRATERQLSANAVVDAEPEESSRVRARRDDPQRRWVGRILLTLVILLAIALAIVGWWFGSGRWATTPTLTGLDVAAATSSAEEAGLSLVEVGEEYSEEVEAGTVISTDPAAGERILNDGEVGYVVSLGPERIDVPEVVGQQEAQAADAIRAQGLEPQVEGQHHETAPAGEVIEQTPEAGAAVKPDDVVNLIVSQGREPIEIVDHTGEPADEAEQALTEAGFAVTREEAPSMDVPEGSVIQQSPDSGDGYANDEIVLEVSSGPDLVEYPDVRMQVAEDAARALEELGYTVVIDGQPGLLNPDGRVLEQRPVPDGEGQPRGSEITLDLRPQLDLSQEAVPNNPTP